MFNSSSAPRAKERITPIPLYISAMIPSVFEVAAPCFITWFNRLQTKIQINVEQNTMRTNFATQGYHSCSSLQDAYQAAKLMLNSESIWWPARHPVQQGKLRWNLALHWFGGLQAILHAGVWMVPLNFKTNIHEQAIIFHITNHTSFLSSI